jgi:hypothetical protein
MTLDTALTRFEVGSLKSEGAKEKGPLLVREAALASYFRLRT